MDGVVPAGFTFTGTGINITDVTGLTLANRQIAITIDSTTLHEGNTSKVTFALPNGITSATDIAITVNAYSAFSANAADFTLTPNTVILPKDMKEVIVILEAIADNTDEPDEQLKLVGTAAGFTVLHSNIISIPGSGAPPSPSLPLKQQMRQNLPHQEFSPSSCPAVLLRLQISP